MEQGTEKNINGQEKKSSRVKKIGRKIILVLLGTFILLVLARMPFVYNKQRTDEQVAKIHATKLTLDDVMGKNLPPDPGLEADKTIEGIDANKNGIRDDVELAIFKEYPDSAKTRAVLLQYALALQMEMTQPIVNTGTVDAVADYGSRSSMCIADTLVPRETMESARSDADMEKINSYVTFVESRQLDTEAREKAQHDFYQGNLKGYDKTNKPACDIDTSILPS